MGQPQQQLNADLATLNGNDSDEANALSDGKIRSVVESGCYRLQGLTEPVLGLWHILAMVVGDE